MGGRPSGPRHFGAYVYAMREHRYPSCCLSIIETLGPEHLCAMFEQHSFLFITWTQSCYVDETEAHILAAKVNEMYFAREESE